MSVPPRPADAPAGIAREHSPAPSSELIIYAGEVTHAIRSYLRPVLRSPCELACGSCRLCRQLKRR